MRVVNGFAFSALRHVSLLFSQNPLGTNCNRKNAYFEGKESNRNSYINIELGRRKNGLEAGCPYQNIIMVKRIAIFAKKILL